MTQSRLSSRFIVLAFLAFISFLFSNCGGGGSSSPGSNGGGGNPLPADFSLSIQPQSVSVAQGSSTTVKVSVNPVHGFTGQVHITISGMPAGITGDPSNFNLSASGEQSVTLSATNSAASGVVSLSVAATSGTLSHTGTFSVAINGIVTGMHPAGRDRYVRTDAQWSYGFLNFFPQRWIIYEPKTKRFFASNTTQNRIDVFDAATELQIGQISIPSPWGADETPDHSTIYVGTQIGDLYAIDPVAMTVTKRFPSWQIGPTGYQAYSVRVMADGRLALLGGQGGIPFIDGYANFGVWNPATNALIVLGSSYGGTGPGQPFVCDFLGMIGQFALNAERTKVLISSAFSDGTLCQVDPDTASYRAVQNASAPILIPPDGKQIIVAGGSRVNIFDAQGFFLADHFQIGDGTGFYRYALSFDGQTLFAIPMGGSVGLAFDWKTHQQKGWFSSFTTDDLISWTTPQAVDESGLIAGVIGNGVSFLDGANLLSSSPGLQVPNPSVIPPAGSPSGGDQVLVVSAISAARLKQVTFGNAVVNGGSVGSTGISVTTPPGNPGPVDVAVTANDGSYELSPEGFSFGPWIVETTPDASTAEGGGTTTLYGYGFGPHDQGQQAPNLQVSIGGQPAPVVQYFPNANPFDVYYPFPIQVVQVRVPPGAAGSKVDVTVSTDHGSITAKNAFTYWPAIQQFPLTGASLIQGIFDKHRGVYYFTDQQQVRVFSRAQGKWLSSIPITGSARLAGIALSPDGSKLAISDAGKNSIYLLNPDTPGTVKTFTLPYGSQDLSEAPTGLAVLNSGIVYYSTFFSGSTGGFNFHKLNTSSGNVTTYQWIQAGAVTADAYTRLSLTDDNARVYFNPGGIPIALDTATDTPYFNPLLLLEGDYEVTLSSNGTWMTASEYLTDTNLNAISFPAYTERETWNLSAVYGEKLSPDGNLLFSPLLNAIDVIDGKRGALITRISLPVTLSPNYDALVADGQDNVLVAITGDAGDGIAVIDLTSIPEPKPLPNAVLTSTLPLAVFSNQRFASKHSGAEVAARNINLHSPISPIKHVIKDPRVLSSH